MGSGLRFEERGSHELKGVPGRWRLLAVIDERPPETVSASLAETRMGDRVSTRVARSFPGVVRAATRIAGRRD